ncbi:MAG TPA: hypothetical protein VGU25_03050 [Acidobacteriaceae bacterium]|nr:hypothetical protein [Acidobacteriaceae bacterium]
MTIYFLVAVVLVLYVALTVLLIRKYLRTHNTGFLWLGAAIVLWPSLMDLFRYVFISPVIHGHSAPGLLGALLSSSHVSPGVLLVSVSNIENSIRLLLLIIAVVFLSRPSIRSAAMIA